MAAEEYLPQKQRIVSVFVSKTSYSEVVELCHRWARDRRLSNRATARYICVTSVHGIVMAHDDPTMSRILNEADIATPDGMPVVWALRSFGSRLQQRVYGPTLMHEICRKAALEGHRLFLYGGREDMLPELESRLLRDFPGLIIGGSYSPPFRALTDSEDKAVQQMICDSDADIVFVGIGSPKQEIWMHQHRECFPGKTLIGVGAAFDFHAGRTRQAPRWVQRSGFEWLFRLLMEPARLWRRYLLLTPRFLPLWAMQKLRYQSPAQ